MNNIKETNIAVVGVSHDPEKYGYRIFVDLLSAGYKVSGVNPRVDDINGVKLYPSLKEILPRPDMVITVVPSSITEKIVEECKELGIRRIWMQPGSSSEKAIAKAREYGILVTDKKCFMVAQGLW